MMVNDLSVESRLPTSHPRSRTLAPLDRYRKSSFMTASLRAWALRVPSPPVFQVITGLAGLRFLSEHPSSLAVLLGWISGEGVGLALDPDQCARYPERAVPGTSLALDQNECRQVLSSALSPAFFLGCDGSGVQWMSSPGACSSSWFSSASSIWRGRSR
jgi:hypothetical protein